MGSSSKKIAKNLRIVNQHAVAALLISVLFIALRLYRNASTASWWLYASLLPTTATYGGTLVLLRAQANDGSDLFQPGVVDYCWDGMWITMFCQLLACYTDWAWALYSIPPILLSAWATHYGWTEYVYPWISRPDGGAADESDATKKRAKAERQMRRQKGK